MFKMSLRLIFFHFLIVFWADVCFTDQSMISLLDEVAAEFDKLEATSNNLNTRSKSKTGHIHSIGQLVLPMLGKLTAHLSDKTVRQQKKQTPKKLFASNKKWKHFIQRDIMAANTLARFMNTNLLMRQIIEGCKAKQYTHARKLFAYLLLHDNRKAPRTQGRRARNPAYKGVFGMIAQIKERIGIEDFAKMMGLKKQISLAFVIDTTGSMFDEIKQLKELVKRIVDEKRNGDVDFILSPFNDYSAEPGGKDKHRHATGFTDKKKFLQALDALKADGGGDCPEMAIHGMERVFRHGFEAGSPMFVITDAGAKDFDMSDNYGVIADSYQPITSIFVSKQTDCISREELRQYRLLVKGRGGSVVTFRSSRIDAIDNFLTPSTLLPTYLSKRKRRSGNRDEYFFYVDDTIDSLNIVVMSDADNKEINLYDNAGTLTVKGKVEPITKGALYSIKHPTSGRYTIDIPRDSNTQITARGSSDATIEFDYFFNMVARVGVRLKNVTTIYPIKGSSGDIVVTIHGLEKVLASSIELAVLNKDDLSTLGKCVLKHHGKQRNRFISKLKVPQSDFKLVLRGKTASNKLIHRLSPTIKPSHILLDLFAAPRGFAVSHTKSTPVIFFLHTYLPHRERFRIEVHPKESIVGMLGHATGVPGRASLFIVRFKATKAVKKHQLQNCVVTVIGNISGLRASKHVDLLVQ